MACGSYTRASSPTKQSSSSGLQRVRAGARVHSRPASRSQTHERRGSAAVNLSRLSIDRPSDLRDGLASSSCSSASRRLSAAAGRAVSGDRAAHAWWSSATYPGAAQTSPTPSPRRSSRRSTASRTCSTCPRSRPATATCRSPSPSSVGTDIDKAQVLVQNRVAVAEPRLPDEVHAQRHHRAQALARPAAGRAPDLAGQHLRPGLHLQLRACSTCATSCCGSTASATSAMFGAREYSMRIWLDPERIALRGLTAERGARRPARAERAGRRRRARPSRRRCDRRSPAVTLQLKGRLDDARRVRGHHRQDRRRRPRRARQGHRPRRARRAQLHRPTATPTATRPSA